jgi:prepilin-type N-terminal cleavage/methylation domain-containing protein
MKKVRLLKKEKGFTLIEVVLSLAILGIVASGFFVALASGSRGISMADEQATAESIARTQMEYVRDQDYIDYSEASHDVYTTTSTPATYGIVLSAVPFDPDTGQPYGESGGVFVQDDGIQSITVIVVHNTVEVFTLEDYRVLR